MSRLCRVDLARSGEIFERLDRYKAALVERLSPAKIILFGSFARGDINEGSDVDLIVVAGWKAGFLERIGILLELNRFGIPLEPLGYTEDEFQKMITEGNPFIMEVLREGKVIYEKLAIHGGRPVRGTFLPYARHTIEADDIAAVTEVLAGEWLTQGPMVRRFEEALAALAGAAHAVVFASGSAALQAACWAAGLGPGDEAITTPLTFVATANAVVFQDARPVFADIDPATLNLDPEAVKRVATERTRALLPVDFAGLPCDYEALLPLAQEHGWVVIEDAAHALGGAYGNRPVGSLADMTMFSFHPAKLITSGEGGAVLTDRPEFAERLRRVRHHGIRYGDPARPWRYEIEAPGSNYRITDFQCALGLSQLRKIERFWTARDRLARRYRERLGGSPFVELPALPAGRRHGWHLFLVLLRLERLSADQDTILQALRAENIGAQLHYPLVYRHPFYRDRFSYGPGLCPVAEEIERRLVTLPLFPGMTEADQEDVLRALDKVFAHFAR